ncbi:MAG: PIN domain-containing protein [Candidatus Bathyarchaeia archaeon]
MYIVETEFLFGLRTDDKWHKQVSKIIELHKKGRITPLFSCASAFLEVGVVLQARGLSAKNIENVLFLMKHQMAQANIVEIELNSDDIIRMYELLKSYNIEYFDAMQAAVTLGRNATLITNDETFKQIGIKVISFQELIKMVE